MRTNSGAIAEFLKNEGQMLVPMVELVDRPELAIDEVALFIRLHKSVGTTALVALSAPPDTA
jgi:hypothetical protein